MDTKNRPPKPWAPPGWKVYWSTRKTQWYWASPAKKTFWELPPDMREPPELSEKEEEVVVPRKRQTRTSKRQRDEAVIEDVRASDWNGKTEKKTKVSDKPKDSDKPKVSDKPKDRQDKPKVRDLCVEIPSSKSFDGGHESEDNKPLNNQDISRMLSSLATIPGLGSASSKKEQDEDDEVVVAAPIDVHTLDPLSHSQLYDEKPMGGSLSPLAHSHDRSLAHSHDRPSHTDTRARADHYSERASVLGNRSREEREDTPSIRMCKHNNWIKSILLESGAIVFGENATFNAMDLACGKGGDLHKWRKVTQKFKQRLGVFYGIDNAPRAIDHCRNVRAKALPSSTLVHWLLEDLEQLDLFERLASQGLIRPGTIHLASMQFALHYFFRSEAALSSIFRLLASAMAEGGIFVATYTDGNAVVRMAREKRWQDAVDAARKNGGGGKNGNTAYYEPAYTTVSSDLFTIQMPAETLKAIEESPDPFGHSFTFSLDNAVRNQKEYLVVDDVLDQVAASFGFRTILAENFQPLTHDMMRVGSHQELMRIMRVFGKEPELHQGEWDAIGLYKARIFVKDRSGVYEPKAKEWIHRYLF